MGKGTVKLTKGQKKAMKIEQLDQDDFLKTRAIGFRKSVDRDYQAMREIQEEESLDPVPKRVRLEMQAAAEAKEAEEAEEAKQAAKEAKQAAKEAKQAAKEGEAPAADATAEGAKGEGEAPAEPSEKPDPYLMADATYIQKDTRWRNKQRTLVFCSRGVTSRYRHLVEDFKKLLPHHKPEPKFEKKTSLYEINEICELKSCNNVIYFETRKRQDLYMWLGRVPLGPCIKFQVLNVHTTGEVKLAGNCLLGSRPIMYFDKNFEALSFLSLIKEMIMQAFGTPRNHPKSKPFHDHAMCFYWLDRKIWFRHYQVTPEAGLDDFNNPERQDLTEIGPRFVLDPIRILGGSFCGKTLFANAHYMSPTALRVFASKMKASPFLAKMKHLEERKEREKELVLPPDPMDDVFE